MTRRAIWIGLLLVTTQVSSGCCWWRHHCVGWRIRQCWGGACAAPASCGPVCGPVAGPNCGSCYGPGDAPPTVAYGGPVVPPGPPIAGPYPLVPGPTVEPHHTNPNAVPLPMPQKLGN